MVKEKYHSPLRSRDALFGVSSSGGRLPLETSILACFLQGRCEQFVQCAELTSEEIRAGISIIALDFVRYVLNNRKPAICNVF